MREIGIGLIGCGTVGSGVVQSLAKNGDLIENRLGIRMVLRRVAVRDTSKPRDVKINPAILTDNADDLIRDRKVEVVVELMGGVDEAKRYVLQALEEGKPVVTANKALLAEHGETIFSAADKSGADLFYEASVAGGIPIVRSLREGLSANHISSMYGILNGTCNFILTRMEEGGLPFDRVLKEAQEAGYAEAVSDLDIDGIDTAHKTSILASLAYGFPVPMPSIFVEGIRDMHPLEIKYAAELGYRIKLLSIIKHHEQGVDVRVHPTLIPYQHPLAWVKGIYNAVVVHGDIAGDTMFYGQGAGRKPTASAVLSDLADVARNLVAGTECRMPAFVAHKHYGTLRPEGECTLRSYLRLSLKDEPGTLAQVAEILGDHQISIASVLQKEKHEGDLVPAIIVTQKAQERQFKEAVSIIDALPIVGAPTIRLRIEDLAEENQL